jgi:hypothetical protein
MNFTDQFMHKSVVDALDQLMDTSILQIVVTSFNVELLLKLSFVCREWRVVARAEIQAQLRRGPPLHGVVKTYNTDGIEVSCIAFNLMLTECLHLYLRDVWVDTVFWYQVTPGDVGDIEEIEHKDKIHRFIDTAKLENDILGHGISTEGLLVPLFSTVPW